MKDMEQMKDMKQMKDMEQMKKVERKRQKEQQVVTQMIRLYCRKNHKKTAYPKQDGLCPDCQQLSVYARARSERCPFMEQKTFCSNCKVHCYKPEMREKIRQVMRFSGPRMLLYHPALAIWHVVCSIREKRRQHD